MEFIIQNDTNHTTSYTTSNAYKVSMKTVSVKDHLLIVLILLAFLSTFNSPSSKQQSFHIQTYLALANDGGISYNSSQKSAGLSLPIVSNSTHNFTESDFLAYRQLTVSKSLIQAAVSSPCFLDATTSDILHENLSKQFITHLKSLNHISDSQIEFLSNKENNLISLALAMQQKYQVPASVILSQAITQSEWGKFVFNNNVFHSVEGNDLVSYTDMESAFNDFAKSLSSNPSYAALFTAGKDYKKWTSLLGSIECNESIFSLEQDCYNKMEVIIDQFNLDLLDY